MWKLFLFSLTGKARQWYTRYVGSVKGEWERLQTKFCLTYFPISCVARLRREVLNFKQEEKESLSVAWAHFIDLVSFGLDLSLTKPTLLQYFYLHLSKNSTQFLDISSRRTFRCNTIGEGRKLLEKVLENTHHTNVYDEPPKEEKESNPKQGEISIPESPTMQSKDSVIDPEPQIPQTLKEEETHPPKHSFHFKAKILDDPASFGNAHKRPSKKKCLNPLEKRSLQKSPKTSPFYASSSKVAHWENLGSWMNFQKKCLCAHK